MPNIRILTGQITNEQSDTPVQVIPKNLKVKKLIVSAARSNTADIYIGDRSVSTSTGFEIPRITTTEDTGAGSVAVVRPIPSSVVIIDDIDFSQTIDGLWMVSGTAEQMVSFIAIVKEE